MQNHIHIGLMSFLIQVCYNLIGNYLMRMIAASMAQRGPSAQGWAAAVMYLS